MRPWWGTTETGSLAHVTARPVGDHHPALCGKRPGPGGWRDRAQTEIRCRRCADLLLRINLREARAQ